MSNYNRNSRDGGDYPRRGSGYRQMHKAVCDECGQNCEVPFRPSGDKPIYCSNCFENKGGGSSNRSGRRNSGGSGYGKQDNTSRQLLEQVTSLNKKLDRILRVIESNVGNKENIETKKVEMKEVKKEAKPEPKEVKKEVEKAVKKSSSKEENKKTKKVTKKNTSKAK